MFLKIINAFGEMPFTKHCDDDYLWDSWKSIVNCSIRFKAAITNMLQSFIFQITNSACIFNKENIEVWLVICIHIVTSLAIKQR